MHHTCFLLSARDAVQLLKSHTAEVVIQYGYDVITINDIACIEIYKYTKERPLSLSQMATYVRFNPHSISYTGDAHFQFTSHRLHG
jgi:hypothetical protein